MNYAALLVAFLVLPYSSGLLAQEISLGTCQQLTNQVEKYTKLRRSGGSAAQMESWKKSRQRYEEQFRRSDCYKYGAQLK